jgi:hypothetical protein
MPAIVTNVHRIAAADYFQAELAQTPTYVFISGTSPWADESAPPNVDDTVQNKIFMYDELVGAKRIQAADVISVLPRNDWQSGNVYDEFNDKVNLVDANNPDTGEPYAFYVITDEFNVYKCISNNYRTISTIKPSGTTINTFQTPDGYIWKYMYTVRSPDAFDYMTPSWIPCYTLSSNDGSNQWLVQQAAVGGTIDHIIVTNGGADYTTSNLPSVTISGDGSGATATAQVDDISGTVESIIITDPGSGYTQATITITDNVGSGVGAAADVVISPVEGHGSDARSELGAVFKMIRVVFEGDEGGVLPTGISYRKAGILSVPRLDAMTGTVLAVANSRLYATGETVVGQTSTAQGTIVSVDRIRQYIYLSNVSGLFAQNENIESQTYNTTQVFQVFNGENLPVTTSVVAAASIKPLSGDLFYASTREKISRGLNQQEEIRLILNF